MNDQSVHIYNTHEISMTSPFSVASHHFVGGMHMFIPWVVNGSFHAHLEAVIKIPKHLQKPDAVEPEGEVRVKIEEGMGWGRPQGR